MLNRRTFICVASAVVGPGRVVSETAPGQIARIGFLGYSARSASSSQFEAFLTGLRELGWIEGKTAVIEYRSVEGHTERLATLVTDPVRSKVDVIMLSGSIGIRAAQAVNSTVPVVFAVWSTCRHGVRIEPRPSGGNTTGLASQFDQLITAMQAAERRSGPSRIALLNYHEATAVTLWAAETVARNPAARPNPRRHRHD
jgi:putative ABC transport system substrate-binding protein